MRTKQVEGDRRLVPFAPALLHACHMLGVPDIGYTAGWRYRMEKWPIVRAVMAARAATTMDKPSKADALGMIGWRTHRTPDQELIDESLVERIRMAACLRVPVGGPRPFAGRVACVVMAIEDLIGVDRGFIRKSPRGDRADHARMMVYHCARELCGARATYDMVGSMLRVDHSSVLKGRARFASLRTPGFLSDLCGCVLERAEEIERDDADSRKDRLGRAKPGDPEPEMAEAGTQVGV